ncbi:MAG: dockerin type I repeat-containing protein [Clostridia bacterium]|nr:dockerin type I repeat-containing protein [Clostridia bacterium]
MLFTVLPLVGVDRLLAASATQAKEYKVGDIIRFGGYPQSRVTDEEMIKKLDAAQKDWKSYRYYSGTGDPYDGQMKPGDWMRYADFISDGVKYRAVTFDSYRPSVTGSVASASYPKQDENRYTTGNTYYFQYESLQWRVLDPAAGLVLCENIIDSQAYQNTVYKTEEQAAEPSADPTSEPPAGTAIELPTAPASFIIEAPPKASSVFTYWQDASKSAYANDYAKSSLRQWLINDFYDTAFSFAEQSEIKETVLDNSASSDSYPQYNSASTSDKIFLLSFDDVRNTAYGFSENIFKDPERMAYGTDYSQCQGLVVYSEWDGSSGWWLRSPGWGSGYACASVSEGLTVGLHFVNITYGVRPAFCFKSGIRESFISSGDVNGDGAIGADDARLALRRSVDLEDYAEDSPEFLACDVNGDKTVGADDARLILRASVDLEDPTSWG